MPKPRVGTNLDKPKNFKQTTKKLISRYLSKYKIALVIEIVISKLTAIIIALFDIYPTV